MIRWGILGCGAIARRMAGVLTRETDACLVAVAARDKERAAAFAADFGGPAAYGSYAELAADERVDAVYVATIHPAHAAAVEICLRAGKAVLCEKPLTMSAAEARRLFDLAAARGVLLMEAMWTRFLPAWEKARGLVEAGAIGELRGMDADFSGWLPYAAESRLFDPAKGGGAMWDVGVYCCHAALHILGRHYSGVRAVGRLTPDGVDSFAAVAVDYGDKMALLTCGSDLCGSQTARIYGTTGWLELPRMFAAAKVVLHTGGNEQTYTFPEEDGFVYEVREFHRLLAENRLVSSIVTPKDTVAAQEMMEAALSCIGSLKRKNP